MPEVIQTDAIGKIDFNLHEFVIQANRVQDEVVFVEIPCAGASVLSIQNARQDYVIEVEGNTFRLSLDSAGGIANYAKISVEEYVLIAVFTGRLIARIIAHEPDFEREDFFHTSDPPCILTNAGALLTYAENLESLYLCPGCHDFFGRNGAASEYNALVQLMDKIEEQRISRSLRRRRAERISQDPH